MPGGAPKAGDEELQARVSNGAVCASQPLKVHFVGFVEFSA